MRICLVTETFPPEVNGVAMTLERLTRGLAERGHDILIVRPKQSKTDGPGKSGRIEQVTVPGVPLPKYNDLHMGLPSKGRLLKLCRAWKPDVIHIATEGPLGFSAMRAAKKLGLPLGSSFHTNFHQYGKHYGYGFLYRFVTAYLRWIHNKAAFTMVPSQDVKEALERDGFKNVVVIARGVDGKLFTPERRSDELRQQWGVDNGQPVAVYVGRIAGEKNIPLAARAFEAVRKIEPAARFVLVGDGPLRAALQKDHPHYIFAGMQRGEDLATHYASGDLFIFASTTETFGNVVTEAMCSGLVVLTYDYAAGRHHIVDGVNGRLAPFDDAEAFVAAAESLIRDRDRWPAIRHAAREKAQTITWDAIVEAFEGELEKARGGRSIDKK